MLTKLCYTLQRKGTSMTQDTLSERQTPQIHTHSCPARKKGPAQVWRIVGNVLFYLVMALILVGAFCFSRSKDPAKSILGFRFYYIQTPSMEPEIPVGSAIFTRYTDPENIRVGDVITYYLKDTSISHQVVEVLPASDETGLPWFRTKGIANAEPDPQLVRGDAVAGVEVLAIPRLGYVMSWIGNHIFLTLWIFVLVCILFALIGRLRRPDKPKHSGKGSDVLE